ncbi:MAG: hypothetical protein OEZ16_01360 [Chromatiales bacterium]|nr:hypothetical protein [Chromatiales bacterium]
MKTLSKSFLTLVSTLVLSACGGGGGGGGGGGNPVISLNCPTYTVGDQLIYRHTSVQTSSIGDPTITNLILSILNLTSASENYDLTRTVTGVTGDVVTMKTTDTFNAAYSAIHTQTSTPTVLELTDTKEYTGTTLDATTTHVPAMRLCPSATVGQAYLFNVNYVDPTVTDGTMTLLMNSPAVTETITVPAGSYSTTKMVFDATFTPNTLDITTTNTVWVNESVGVVKSILHATYTVPVIGGTVEVTNTDELTSATIAAIP